MSSSSRPLPTSTLTGLTPSETAFLASHEPITIVPRSALPPITLLSGTTPSLAPPTRATVPLWLALLLSKQGKANIVPPPWFNVTTLSEVLAGEMRGEGFTPATPLPRGERGEGRGRSAHSPPPWPSPPFLPHSAASTSASHPPPGHAPYATHDTPLSLPYHWLTLAHLLLSETSTSSSSDSPFSTDAEPLRRLIRDLRETRAAKIRAGLGAGAVEGGREVRITGVGGAEVAEYRAFLGGVQDGLRRVGWSAEVGRREAAEENGLAGTQDGDDEDMDDD